MPLYAATVFLSAFLLFLVQPVIARQILPWFGGSAAVWATCLVFFQSVLLAGYAYSDFLIRKLQPRRQLIVHTAMLLLSLAWLPIAPGAQWKPTGDENPTLLILGLLVVTIGLPYLMLSTTSPLIQAWYWRRYQSKVPYRLFALSNFASLLALLAYPVAIEPWIPNRGQTTGWSLAYVAFVVLCSVTGYASIRAQAKAPVSELVISPAHDTREPAASKLSAKQLFTWILLSATGSCMLLAVSSHITQNIAAVPFLWVLPLALYLFSLRWRDRPAQGPAYAPGRVRAGWIALALAYPPAWMFREANPEWRLLAIVFAGLAVLTAFQCLAAVGGRAWVRHFAGPVLFFLTAIPWPSVLEKAATAVLMPANATIALEVLHWLQR